MIYIGYIVDREIGDVEVFIAEDFDGLEAQIDQRFDQLRDENDWEEPEDENEEDPLGERYDWNYVTRPELVKKENTE